MKEFQRIISKGFIKPEFFEQETKEEFLVDTKRKKIWAIELDLLLEFDAFCKKHSLTYFLMYGTLLGAIRHKGFVPWDDDMDIVMPRKDYEFFVDKSDEFKFPFFLQTPITDPASGFSFAKLKNSNTTCVNELFKYQDMNFGIHIDILPIDNFVDEGAKERFQKINELNLDASTYMRKDNPYLDDKNLARVKKHSGKTPKEVYFEIQNIATQFNDIPTKKVTVAPLTLYSLEKIVFNKEDFESAIEGDFHGFKFPIPVGYKRILTTLYGDYLQLPPLSERGNWHSGAVFDPDMPYKEYLEKNR